jgi:hypothetical protein
MDELFVTTVVTSQQRRTWSRRRKKTRCSIMLNSSNHSLFPHAEFHEENLPSGGAWRTLEALRGGRFTSEEGDHQFVFS